jgi:serine protease inhibitor
MDSCCTFKETGSKYYPQHWAPCFDCFLGSNEGACMYCIANCHQGHNVGPIRYGPFFCDCGYQKKCTEKSSTYITASNIFQSSNILAQKLFDVFEQNCVYSPLSIAYIMSILHLGSVGNTEMQITNLLTIKNSMDDLLMCSKIFNTDIIKLANAILVNKNMPIREEYLQMARQLALVSNEDFSNRNAIVTKANQFIETNTNNLVKDILKENMIGMDTVMILINTIYFKTYWDKPFKNIRTRKEKFNSVVDVEMMENTMSCLYREDEVAQLVELMYKGKEFCMGIILPKEPLSINVCTNYLKGDIPLMPTEVQVHIPKFTQRKNIDLVPYMKKLGVMDIFTLASEMDRMVSVPAYVSTMIHEAVVIVDEAGTEAAAVTVAAIKRQCMMMKPEPIIFYANRSFVYYIKHMPTNTLLFVGDFHGN